MPFPQDVSSESTARELIPKKMHFVGRAGLEAWIRTTWLPLTGRVPQEDRPELIAEVAERYIEAHPPDGEGVVGVRMVRLEVEVVKA